MTTLPVPDEVATEGFTADTSPTNQFGERRFVDKLGWFGPVNLLVVLAAAIPTSAVAGLLSYRFTGVLDPTAANAAIGVASMSGAFAGAVTSIIAGNISDHTRTRFGRRNPGIMLGAAITTVAILGLAFVPFTAVWPVVALFCVFQLGLNLFLANYTALLPDRVASGLMGKASAWAALGSLLGTALGSATTVLLIKIFGVENMQLGYTLLPWTIVIAMTIIVILLPGAKLVRDPNAPKLSVSEMFESFRPPKDRDFWFAYLGRLFIMIALMSLLQTQTQLLRYHFGLSIEDAAQLALVLSLLLAVFGLLSTAIAGPLSDKIGRRKLPVMIAAGFFVASSGVLLITNETWILYVNTILAAIAFGAFMSVDQALMVEILPNPETAARDLGFLGTTNTLSGVIGGGIGAALIGLGGYDTLFITAIVLAVIGILFFVPIKRVK